MAELIRLKTNRYIARFFLLQRHVAFAGYIEIIVAVIIANCDLSGLDVEILEINTRGLAETIHWRIVEIYQSIADKNFGVRRGHN